MRVVEEIMVLICFICPVSGAGDQFFSPIMSIYTIDYYTSYIYHVNIHEAFTRLPSQVYELE